MRNIKITLEYDGTNFNGWQIQDKKCRTVQGEIKKALKQIFKSDITVIGAGRTDSGVHASGQVANFKINSPMSADEILRALNANLPEDISLLKAEETALAFHAQFAAKSKTYRYCILNRQLRSALQRNSSWHIIQKLNLPLMRKEAKCIIGRHDFRSFMAMDASQRATINEKNTIRTIKRLEIVKKGNFIFITIEANGFLYKMVRNIVGTLVEVGLGKLQKGSIKAILYKKNRWYASATAPGRGLCLVCVNY